MIQPYYFILLLLTIGCGKADTMQTIEISDGIGQPSYVSVTMTMDTVTTAPEDTFFISGMHSDYTISLPPEGASNPGDLLYRIGNELAWMSPAAISGMPVNGVESHEEFERLKSLLQSTIIAPVQTIYSKSIVDLLELYQEYETLCWNDSTLVISAGSSSNFSTPTYIDSLGRKVMDLTETFFVNSVYQIKKEWVHKEPTFHGFVEWLRKTNQKDDCW